MKRFLACFLILLLIGVINPQPAWSVHRIGDYDTPGESVGSGDDDDPTFHAQPDSTDKLDSGRSGQEAVARPRSVRARESSSARQHLAQGDRVHSEPCDDLGRKSQQVDPTMKKNPQGNAPSSKINRADDMAHRLVGAQYSSRALRVLEVLQRLPLEPSHRFRVEALRIQCWIDQGRLPEAENALSSLRVMAESAAQVNTVDLLQASCLARGAHAFLALGIAARVLRRVGRHGEDAAKSYRIVGVALYRAAHYRWAGEAFELSAALYRLAGNKVELAQVLGNIGLVHKNLGRTTVALSYLDESVRLLPKQGHYWTRLHNLEYRGICFIRLGRIEEARVSLLAARTLARKIRQDLVSIAVDNNLGHIYRMEGNFATAREFYEEALRAARDAKTPRKEALALEFLGETCIEEGHPADAIRLLDEALALATPLAGHGDVVMEVLRRRGEAKLALGKRTEGLEDLKRAIDLCGARRERRERVLAQRAFDLASPMPIEDFAVRSATNLRELQELGDRFEYARTVCLLLEDGRLGPSQHSWLADAQASAMHYVSSLGLRVWKERLQRVAGHAHQIRPEPSPTGIVHHPDLPTRSAVYSQTLEAARIAARSREPALILGETGSGKEVIARLVHEWSARSGGPLVAINCGAIPESLIESELFGHVRGAFTGADRDRAGLFEGATGGTVLLDEVGDLPPQVQVKLLRFLDSYEFRRVGEHRVRRSGRANPGGDAQGPSQPGSGRVLPPRSLLSIEGLPGRCAGIVPAPRGHPGTRRAVLRGGVAEQLASERLHSTHALDGVLQLAGQRARTPQSLPLLVSALLGRARGRRARSATGSPEQLQGVPRRCGSSPHSSAISWSSSAGRFSRRSSRAAVAFPRPRASCAWAAIKSPARSATTASPVSRSVPPSPELGPGARPAVPRQPKCEEAPRS